MTLREFASELEGHPTPRIPRVDAATGSLGQGLSVGAGLAIGSQNDIITLGDTVTAGPPGTSSRAPPAATTIRLLSATVPVTKSR
jgi:hypothetical protein